MLEKLSKKELIELKEMLSMDPEFLNKEIAKKEQKEQDVKDYYVTRTAPFIKEIDEALMAKVDELLLYLNISSLHFLDKCRMKKNLFFDELLWSFEDFRNIASSYGFFNKSSFGDVWFKDNDTYTKILIQFGVQRGWRCVSSLQCLLPIFENTENIWRYEEIYNTLRYLKNHIYTIVLKDNTVEENYKLFYFEKSEKEELVREGFIKIVNYLYQEVSSLENARLSVFHQSLSRWPNKIGTQFTVEQKRFIEMVALCTSKEELEEKDYKKLRELIYIPRKDEYVKALMKQRKMEEKKRR